MGKNLTQFNCRSTPSKIGQHGHFEYFDRKHEKLSNQPSNQGKFYYFKHLHYSVIKKAIFEKIMILAHTSR